MLEAEWRQILQESMSMRAKKDELSTGCWISPCYGPFSLGACCETYEPFISLILEFFGAAVNHG
jgi:hypothetical protein